MPGDKKITVNTDLQLKCQLYQFYDNLNKILFIIILKKFLSITLY